MAVKIDAHPVDFEARKQSIEDWQVPVQVKTNMYSFLDDLALGKVNRGRRISDATRVKYISLLKIPLEFINKPLNKMSRKDIEAFERNLGSGQIRTRSGKPFSQVVMADIRIALKIFLRWKLGTEKANRLTDWLDTRDIRKTPDYLSERDIEKLFKHCKSPQERFLIAVLFDTGARAEEFLNIRSEDIQLPEGNVPFVKVTLKAEYSKTEGRTISLYWKHSLDSVKDYLEQRRTEGMRSIDPVFNCSYAALRSFLARLGTQVLARRVHPHLFRHSSATYYASEMNRQELCIRYGWRFSSNMPDVYIARAGVDSKRLDEQFTGSELARLKEEFRKKEHEDKLKQEKFLEMEKKLAVMESKYEQIAEVLSLKPAVHELEEAISRKMQLRAR